MSKTNDLSLNLTEVIKNNTGNGVKLKKELTNFLQDALDEALSPNHCIDLYGKFKEICSISDFDSFIYKNLLNLNKIKSKSFYPFGIKKLIGNTINKDNKLVILNFPQDEKFYKGVSFGGLGLGLKQSGFNHFLHEETGFCFYVKITPEDDGGYIPDFKVEVILEEEFQDKVNKVINNIETVVNLLENIGVKL